MLVEQLPRSSKYHEAAIPVSDSDADRERESSVRQQISVAPDLATTNGFRYGSTTMFG